MESVFGKHDGGFRKQYCICLQGAAAMALHVSLRGGFAASCGDLRADERLLVSRFVATRGAIAGRQSFFGCMQSLRCCSSSSSSFSCPPVLECKRLVTTAVIKRMKDYSLDAVIDREKKLKRMIKVKEILVKQPGEVMSLRDLGKYRRYIGLTGKKRIITLLKMFPAVFQVYEENAVEYFRFTSEFEKQYLEEKKLHKEMEHVAVTKLRKLLMMSVDRSIAVQKIKHIRRELGLPEDFLTSDFLSRHSQYFKVGSCGLGPLLILEEWDPELAITALGKAAQDKQKAREELEKDLAWSLGEEIEKEESLLALFPRFEKTLLKLPKNLKVKKHDRIKLLKFQEFRTVSPYQGVDKINLKLGSPEAEKAAVLVVHELLSLTSDKKIRLDHLTHFRRDFKFSQQIRGMLTRHPEYFYVSLKGSRDHVFLHEAYENSQLKEKDPLVLMKERMTKLVSIGRLQAKLDDIRDGDSEDEDEDNEDDDDDWDDDDDENRFENLVGITPAQKQRAVATGPAERW